MNIANVVPIPRVRSHLPVISYRPTSIFPSHSNIPEKMKFYRNTLYIQVSNFFAEYQQKFRKENNPERLLHSCRCYIDRY